MKILQLILKWVVASILISISLILISGLIGGVIITSVWIFLSLLKIIIIALGLLMVWIVILLLVKLLDMLL